jgi:hypothetical protein
VAICHAFLSTNAKLRRCQCKCSGPQARRRYSGPGSYQPSACDTLPALFTPAPTPVFASTLSDVISQTSTPTRPYIPDGHLQGPIATNLAQPQPPTVPRMSIFAGPTQPVSFKGIDLMTTIPSLPTTATTMSQDGPYGEAQPRVPAQSSPFSDHFCAHRDNHDHGHSQSQPDVDPAPAATRSHDTPLLVRAPKPAPVTMTTALLPLLPPRVMKSILHA